MLGRLYADRAFRARGLTGPEALSQLDIAPGCNELRLGFRDELADVPFFRRSIKTSHGWKISPDQRLTYAMLYGSLKALGILTGLREILRPYTLRYGAGKAFDDNGEWLEHSDSPPERQTC